MDFSLDFETGTAKESLRINQNCEIVAKFINGKFHKNQLQNSKKMLNGWPSQKVQEIIEVTLTYRVSENEVK